MMPCIYTKKKIVNIEVDKITASPYQPRTRFDEETLEELSGSIARYGVIQPVAVRRSEHGYELVAGERRLRATKMAGLKYIPAIIGQYDEDEAAEIALIENLQRENLSFMEEAEAYMALIQKHHMTQEELAERIGKKQSTVANKLRLLKLPPKVKQLISEYSLTERHARAVLRLPNEALQCKALYTVIDKNYNVQMTDKLIDRLLEEEKGAEKQKKTYLIKDIRIFSNTIKQAVEVMKQSGVKAAAKRSDRGEYIEYVITIPKQ